MVEKDSSSWGNYRIESGLSVIEETGSNSEWSANNIYDLAGNAYEWTQEASFPFGRTFRGGMVHIYF